MAQIRMSAILGRNQKGSIDIIVVVLLFAVVLVGAFWIYNQSKENRESQQGNAELAENENSNQNKPIRYTLLEAVDELRNKNFPDNWAAVPIVYDRTTDLYFKHPANWEFSQIGAEISDNYFLIKPKFGVRDLLIGGPEANHQSEGRNVLLTDYTDFKLTNGTYSLELLNSGEYEQTQSEYSPVENPSMVGIVNQDVEYLGRQYRHAILKSSGRTSALNVAVPADDLAESEFNLIIENLLLVDTSI